MSRFLGHGFSVDSVRLNDAKVATLTCMPMPMDIKYLPSLLDGLG